MKFLHLLIARSPKNPMETLATPDGRRQFQGDTQRLILETTVAWEKEGIAHGEIRPVIGAVDETFLQRMMLVFMDLATGYWLMGFP